MESLSTDKLWNARISLATEVWQKGGQYTEQGEVWAHMVNEFDAVLVSNFAQYSGTDPGYAESDAEEEAWYGTHFARNKFLSEHEDSREGGGKNKTNDESENAGQCKIRIWHDKREGCWTQDWEPNNALSSDTVTDGSTHDGPRRHCE